MYCYFNQVYYLFTPLIKNCWKDGEATHQYKNSDLAYSYNGTVYYVKEDGKQIELKYKGYDKGNDSARYGFHRKYNDPRIFQITLEKDRRIIVPVGRQSQKFKRLYKKRTSVERVNGRIDRNYGFEKHTIRGLKKMKMFLAVTFLVGLSMAKAKIEMGNQEHLATLVS